SGALEGPSGGEASDLRQAEPSDRPLRLEAERRDGPVVELARLLVGVADGRQAERPELGEAAPPPEDDARLRRVVEVEAVPDDEVEDLVRRDRPVRRRGDLAGGNRALRLPPPGLEAPLGDVVAAVREERECQERDARLVLPELHLKRLVGPR